MSFIDTKGFLHNKQHIYEVLIENGVYKNDFVHCNHKRGVQYLRDHTFLFTWTDEDTRYLFDWAKSSNISHQTLCETIHKRSQSDSNSSSTRINFISEISLNSQMDFHMLMS